MSATTERTCTVCGEAGLRVVGVARVVLSEGCQAFPDARAQVLCGQHLHSVEPIASMEVFPLRSSLEGKAA